MKRLHDSDDEEEPATKKAAPSLDKPTDILAQVNVHSVAISEFPNQLTRTDKKYRLKQWSFLAS